MNSFLFLAIAEGFVATFNLWLGTSSQSKWRVFNLAMAVLMIALMAKNITRLGV